MSSEYELQRERNIAANKALLAQLGLEKPLLPPPKPACLLKKRKTFIPGEASRKSARVAQNAEDRRNYPEEDFSTPDHSEDSDEDEDTKKPRKKQQGRKRRRHDSDDKGPLTEGDSKGLKRRVVNGRNVQRIDRNHERPDPRVYGPIKGIKVGHWWETRMACSADGVHAPTVGGISGSGNASAFSVALSGGYEDDIDEGFRFTFTGSGGRDLKGTKNKPKNLRTAPQSKDQTLASFNLSLKLSCDTGLPVRVIRGYKAELGPETGYRYDGLYQVLRAWEDVGMSGFKVWRFAFKRMDGQAPIDFKAGPPADSDDESRSESDADIKATESEHEFDSDFGIKAAKSNTGFKAEFDSAIAKSIDTAPSSLNTEDKHISSENGSTGSKGFQVVIIVRPKKTVRRSLRGGDQA